MITGFNTDLVHNGETYHIQTQERGVNSFVIDTYLYKSGRVIDSFEVSYEHIKKDDDFVKNVRILMSRQHNKMVKMLKEERLPYTRKLYHKARKHASLKEYEQAGRYIKEAIQLSPSDKDIIELKEMIDKNFKPKGKGKFKTIVGSKKLENNNEEGRFSLEDELKEEENETVCIENPGNKHAGLSLLIEKGLVYLSENKNLDKAILLFEEVLQADPDNIDASQLLKEARLKLKEKKDKEEKAKADLNYLFKFKGKKIKSIEHAIDEGFFLMGDQQLEMALEIWSKALKYDPENKKLKRFIMEAEQSIEKKRQDDTDFASYGHEEPFSFENVPDRTKKRKEPSSFNETMMFDKKHVFDEIKELESKKEEITAEPDIEEEKEEIGDEAIKEQDRLVFEEKESEAHNEMKDDIKFQEEKIDDDLRFQEDMKATIELDSKEIDISSMHSKEPDEENASQTILLEDDYEKTAEINEDQEKQFEPDDIDEESLIESDSDLNDLKKDSEKPGIQYPENSREKGQGFVNNLERSSLENKEPEEEEIKDQTIEIDKAHISSKVKKQKDLHTSKANRDITKNKEKEKDAITAVKPSLSKAIPARSNKTSSIFIRSKPFIALIIIILIIIPFTIYFGLRSRAYNTARLQANELFAQRDFPNAITILNEAINRFPRDQDLLELRARSYFESHNYTKASEDLYKLAEMQGYSDKDILFLIARTESIQKNHSKLKNIIDIIIEYDSSAGNLFRLGELAYDADYNELAIELFEKAFDQEPQNWNILMQKSRIYFEMGELEKARQGFITLYQLDRINKEYPFFLARIYYQIEEYRRALFYLEQIAGRDADPLTIDHRVFHLWGDIYQKMNIHSRAFAKYNKAKEVLEDKVTQADSLSRELAQIYSKTGSIWLDRAVEFNDPQGSAVQNAGRDLERAIELEPYNPDYYKILSDIYLFMNDHENAVKNLQRAIDYDSFNPDYYLSLSKIYSNYEDNPELGYEILKRSFLDNIYNCALLEELMSLALDIEEDETLINRYNIIFTIENCR